MAANLPLVFNIYYSPLTDMVEVTLEGGPLAGRKMTYSVDPRHWKEMVDGINAEIAKNRLVLR